MSQLSWLNMLHNLFFEACDSRESPFDSNSGSIIVEIASTLFARATSYSVHQLSIVVLPPLWISMLPLSSAVVKLPSCALMISFWHFWDAITSWKKCQKQKKPKLQMALRITGFVKMSIRPGSHLFISIPLYDLGIGLSTLCWYSGHIFCHYLSTLSTTGSLAVPSLLFFFPFCRMGIFSESSSAAASFMPTF